MSEFDYEKMGEALARALKASGTDGKPGSTGAVKPKDAKDLDVFIQHLKQMNSLSNKWNDAFKKNIGQITGVNENLNELDAAIEKTTDIYDKDQLVKKKEAVIRAASNAILVKETKSVADALGTATKSITISAGSLTRKLLDGTSGVEFATGVMTAGIDIAGAATGQMGQSATSAGTALMGAGGKAKAFGAALVGAGTILGATSTASAVLTFGVEVLGKEVEKTVTAFNLVTASGALYVDGMTGMRNSAASAGLTVDMFSKVLQTNSENLATSGLSVAGGAKLMGQAITAGGNVAKTQLLKLGYSVEEQAGLYAETIADLRRPGNNRQLVPQEIATQTMKYAESLRLLTALTGEDAKKKVEAVRNENQILEFQAQLARKTPEQQSQITAAMAKMTEQDRKNFRDRVILGTVINQEGALQEANIAGVRERNEAIMQLWNENAMTVESVAKQNAKYSSTITASIDSMQALGQAGYATTGITAEFAKGALTLKNSLLNQTEAGVEAAKSGVQGQKNATDALTDSVVKAQVAVVDFQVKLQDLMTKPMQDFSVVMAKVLEELRKAVDGLSNNKSTWDKVKSAGASITDKAMTRSFQGAAGGAIVGGIGGAVIGAPLGGIGAVPGALGGAALGSKIGGWGGAAIGAGEGIYDVFFGPGKSNGGIASGPASGYLEKLHGTELVVPLTAQGTIKEGTVGHTELLKMMSETAPVASAAASTTTSSAPLVQPTADLGGLVTAMTALLTTARDQLDKQDEMLRVMADNRDNTERLYHAMS